MTHTPVPFPLKEAHFLFSLHRWPQQMPLWRPLSRDLETTDPTCLFGICHWFLSESGTPALGWDPSSPLGVSHLTTASALQLGMSPLHTAAPGLCSGECFPAALLQAQGQALHEHLQTHVSAPHSCDQSFCSPGKYVWFHYHSENNLPFLT